MLKKIFEFLVGKKPPIFNPDGTIKPAVEAETWELWKKRYASEANRNWRNHTGIRAKDM